MDIKEILGNQNEKPLDRLVSDGGFSGIFRRIGCVGDSLSSGEFEATAPDGSRTYHDYFEHSWGQYLARMNGSEVLNFSRGGMTAREYCTSFADHMRFWDAKNACHAYILALGINDLVYQKMEPGSVADIDPADHHNNKDTFAGHYAAIIQRLKVIQPKAHFFLMTMMNEGDGEQDAAIRAHRDFLFELEKRFDNIHVMDFYTYGPVYDEAFREKFYLNGHLNPMGYQLTARMVASYMDYIIRHDMNAFKEVGFIGTDLRG